MKKIILQCAFLLTVLGYSQSTKELKTINKAAADITMEVDKFDDKTTWRSPYFGKGIAATTSKRVRFIKSKDKDGNYSIYLKLTAYGSTLNIGEKGFILLFEDGTKIERPNAEVDYKNDSGTAYWEYSIFERITEEELDMFVTKKVDVFRLYIYEAKPITKKATLQVMGYAKGIKEAK